MIEINLLPPRFKKRKSRFALDLSHLPRENTLLAVGGVVCLLIIIHILLVGMLVVQKARLSGLNREWAKIAVPKKEVDDLKAQISQIEKRMNSFDAVTSKTREIVLAQKLNQISDFLPSGVWLTKLAYLNDQLVIEGSAIGKNGEEMVTIGKLASLLKSDSSFTKEFASIELSSINRRLIKSVEVADFAITCSLRNSLR